MKLKFPHLGQRWLTALGGREAAREAHSDRLRDVLGRDRALAVGTRVHARSAPDPSPQPRALALVAPPAEQVAPQPDLQPAQREPSAPGAQVLASAIDPSATAAGATAASIAAELDSTPVPSGAPQPVAAVQEVPAAAELAPAASEERPQRVQHEPIRTRTMARLLAAQGYRQRALAIYDELLARPGADDALRAEAEALRLRSA